MRGLHRDHENMSAAADIAVLGPCENISQYSPWPGQGYKAYKDEAFVTFALCLSTWQQWQEPGKTTPGQYLATE